MIINTPEIAAMSGLIQTYGAHKSVNGGPRGYHIYHPSAAGKCLRLMQYQRFAQHQVAGLKLSVKQFQGKTQRIFDGGHSMHQRWAQYWQALGVLRGVWQCSNRLCNMWTDGGVFNPDEQKATQLASSQKLHSRKYGTKQKIGCFKPQKCVCGCSKFQYHESDIKDDELNVFGHCDLILDFRNFDADKYFNTGNPVRRLFNPSNLPKGVIVADMKTINNRRYEQVCKNGPGLDYQVQLKVYANVLEVDYGVLIYENKDTSAINMFKIQRSEDVDWPIISNQLRTMNKWFEAKRLPPPRPASKDCYQCKKCQFNKTCHASSAWANPDLHNMRQKFYGHLLEGKH